MTSRVYPITRRRFLAVLGAAILDPAMPFAAAQERKRLPLLAGPGRAALRPGQPDTPIWSLLAPEPEPRFRRGDELDVTLRNDLPVPTVLNWHGIDGAVAAEPLAGRPPLASGTRDTFVIPLRHAGTFLYDLRLLGDGLAKPLPARALIVAESEQVPVDRDEVAMIEDWRLRPDGSIVTPGSDVTGTVPIYTVNGRTSLDIVARARQRLRIRFINSCHRNVIAVKIEDHDAHVMAIDSQPSEPFPARNGQLVLAPGTRVDVFIDAVKPPGSTSSILLHDGTEPRTIGRLVISGDAPVRPAALPPAPPLPSNGLPAQLDLKNAARVELSLGGSQADWVRPSNFAAASAPAFRVKPGRTVVLALTNRDKHPYVFHLHGHHVRLLDRLDDGWKPFWLDTLVVDAGQTQRVAFAAEHIGHWLMESVATDWSAPRLVRWYGVE